MVGQAKTTLLKLETLFEETKVEFESVLDYFGKNSMTTIDFLNSFLISFAETKKVLERRMAQKQQTNNSDSVKPVQTSNKQTFNKLKQKETPVSEENSEMSLCTEHIQLEILLMVSFEFFDGTRL